MDQSNVKRGSIMIHKMFYSDTTKQAYSTLLEAQQAETTYNENIEKFDKTRKAYLHELEQLRNKYEGQFTSLLDSIEGIVNSNQEMSNQALGGWILKD